VRQCSLISISGPSSSPVSATLRDPQNPYRSRKMSLLRPQARSGHDGASSSNPGIYCAMVPPVPDGAFWVPANLSQIGRCQFLFGMCWRDSGDEDRDVSTECGG